MSVIALKNENYCTVLQKVLITFFWFDCNCKINHWRLAIMTHSLDIIFQ